MKNEIKFYWVIGGSIVLSVFILSSFSTLRSSVSYFFPNKDDISVTGSTRMDFTSNLIVWKGRFIKKDMNLKNAYSQIKKDKKTIQ